MLESSASERFQLLELPSAAVLDQSWKGSVLSELWRGVARLSTVLEEGSPSCVPCGKSGKEFQTELHLSDLEWTRSTRITDNKSPLGTLTQNLVAEKFLH